MPVHEISDLSDARLAPFRQLRHKNWIESSGWFIAEGPLLVDRLLRSQYRCQSLLIDRKYQSQFASRLDEDLDVLLIEHDLVHEVVGFDFHRGILGCGCRSALPDLRQTLVEPLADSETLVATVGVQDPENMGCILRCCAALGVQRVIIGPGSADPLGRRALRVSMGGSLRLQLLRSRDLSADLTWLRDRSRLSSFATSLDGPAMLLSQVRRQGPALILLGNERNGVPAEILKQADHCLQIEMEQSGDSLNVCAAASILLHYFCRLS